MKIVNQANKIIRVYLLDGFSHIIGEIPVFARFDGGGFAEFIVKLIGYQTDEEVQRGLK